MAGAEIEMARLQAQRPAAEDSRLIEPPGALQGLCLLQCAIRLGQLRITHPRSLHDD